MNYDGELYNEEEVLSMDEFLSEYSDIDDLDCIITEQINEIEYDALMEYGMVNSFMLQEADGVVGAIQDAGKDIQKKFTSKKPVATNIFVRIFNVIKNAFGVVAAFAEKAKKSFAIDSLKKAIKSMPDTVRYQTFKVFIDGSINNFLKALSDGMNTALSFLKSIFILGRTVDQKKCDQYFKTFGNILKSTGNYISEHITQTKGAVLRQLDSLQRQFQHYSTIKVMHRTFLTVANACSNPLKMANLVDKLGKAQNGQGIKGGAGMALDVANKVVGDTNIMKIPGMSFIVNGACKLIGRGLAEWKKFLTLNLQSIKTAYNTAFRDDTNKGAIRDHAHEMKKYI